MDFADFYCKKFYIFKDQYLYQTTTTTIPTTLTTTTTTTTTLANNNFKGCYNDNSNYIRDFPYQIAQGILTDNGGTTVELCQKSCGIAGYKFSGVQFG